MNMTKIGKFTKPKDLNPFNNEIIELIFENSRI